MDMMRSNGRHSRRRLNTTTEQRLRCIFAVYFCMTCLFCLMLDIIAEGDLKPFAAHFGIDFTIHDQWTIWLSEPWPDLLKVSQAAHSQPLCSHTSVNRANIGILKACILGGQAHFLQKINLSPIRGIVDNNDQ